MTCDVKGLVTSQVTCNVTRHALEGAMTYSLMQIYMYQRLDKQTAVYQLNTDPG